MKLKSFIVLCSLVAALFLFAQRQSPRPGVMHGAVADLTHTLNDSAPINEFEAVDKMKVESAATYEKNGYMARTVTLPEQSGTHIDAPAYFVRGQWTADQIPAERLVRPVAVIDVTDNVKTDPDYKLTLQDLALWEQQYGHVPTGAVVVLRTGWDDRWTSPRDYRNADPTGRAHFPGFSVDAARFLVEGRLAVGLGIDTMSVDGGGTSSSTTATDIGKVEAPRGARSGVSDFAVHQYCQTHAVYLVENLANLWQVPATGATVVVAPAKIEGAAGAPARVMAMR